MHRWLAVLLLVHGCAFALDGPDPERPRNQLPRCDTTKGLVVLDGLMATAAGVVALSLVSADESAVALLPAAIGALYVGGAVRGNNNVNACRAAMDGYAMSMNHGPLPLDESRQSEDTVASGPSEPTAGPTVPMAPAAVNPPGGPSPIAAPPPFVPPQPQPVQPQPQPVQAQPPAQPLPRAPAKASRPSADDAWGEFWKEVP